MTSRAASQGLREHSLFLLYAASLGWLMFACYYYASAARMDPEFVQPLLLFGAVFVGLYVLLWFLLRRRLPQVEQVPLPDGGVRIMIAVLFALFAGVVVMHLTTLGYLPMVEAHRSDNDYEIARIRQEGYYSLARWQRYASDYAIKGVGPILLVLAAQYRSRLLYPALAVGLFYTTSLFVKANSVYLLLPLVFYFSFTRAWKKAALMALLIVVSVGINWTSSSPPVREDVARLMEFVEGKGMRKPRDIPTADSSLGDYPGAMVVASVRERLFIVPARVTAQWYFQYEEPERREDGCGYRLVARMLGCEYQHMPTKLYAIYHEDLVRERGLTGSLNSGSYIHDFANFGYVGVLAGAVLFAFLFTALRYLCRNSPAALCLSLMPVLSLIEMPLSTVLNSGGWLLVIFASLLLQQGGRLRAAAGPQGA
ncbi:hypothetical protein [Ramlibacter pallidus]|uniref:Oligosaccharide repeat unit polymerase n=1 Tax=Ramlibacter pallidus TaxID=2780087 RepID=A0ABR9RYE3_9BURK|nr:hypothetical protein [Ramlibacter pallidus]MBE7366264.1 hypothetical protein [Ramlibacter pallidus]